MRRLLVTFWPVLSLFDSLDLPAKSLYLRHQWARSSVVEHLTFNHRRYAIKMPILLT